MTDHEPCCCNLRAENRRLRNQADELQERLDTLQTMHRLYMRGNGIWCLECTKDPARPVAWPCDTVLTARGDTIT